MEEEKKKKEGNGIGEETVEKINNNQTYEETYTIRKIGGGMSVSIPKIVIKRKAKEGGMSVEEFLDTHVVAALFDSFTDIDLAYRFIEKEEEDEEGG